MSLRECSRRLAVLAMLLTVNVAWLIAQEQRELQVGEILPLSINSSDHDYAPMITADGSTLYFCSNREGGLGGHDVWFAVRTGDSPAEFDGPHNLGEPVNSAKSEGVASLSADGRTIYFTACLRDGGEGDCDIFAAELFGGKIMRIVHQSELSSPSWETSPTVSADGRVIAFVSSRPGGYGEADIYVAIRKSDGSWGPPRALAPPVNSASREDSPFLHPNGRYLFFSSNRRGGEGGLDFYVSVLHDDGWGMPMNLGSKLNSRRDERFISMPAKSDVLYFASERRDITNQGGLDLFVATGVKLPPLPEGPADTNPTITASPDAAYSSVDVLVGGPLASERSHELIVTDASGATVARAQFEGIGTTVDIATLPDGEYTFTIGTHSTTLVVSR